MSNNNFENDIKTARVLLSKKKLEPFLKYIRFPQYRNLSPNLRIDFSFPLTAIVGQNGVNKSSVLRAVWGAPGDNSIGKLWFSSHLDKHEERPDRPRFIYGYYQPEADEEVEVIKTMIQRSFIRTVGKQKRKRIEPDYWEPARPSIKDGMRKMPPLEEGAASTGRSKTRWNTLAKAVEYLDFRSEISAFDKYMYHGDFYATLTRSTKQDAIRQRSRNLKAVIDKNLSSLKLYKKEQILKNYELEPDELEQISTILGRPYVGARVVQHKLFFNSGYSVILQTSFGKYSEAWAGSGEFAVVILVTRTMRAEKGSLIVLDEPEVSLHPGAQRRLTQFLLKQTIVNKHQFVLGTHSPFIIQGLPPDAVKTLFADPASGIVRVLNSTEPHHAFFHLGVEVKQKTTIIVEDRLSEKIVLKCLRILGESAYKSVDVKVIPGGAATFLCHFAPAYSATATKNILFFLDGDQKPQESIPDNIDSISDADLGIYVKYITKNGSPSFYVDGGASGGRQDQIPPLQRQYLKFWHTNVRYFPFIFPEAFIWDSVCCTALKGAKISTNDYKTLFRDLALKDLGRAAYEGVSADEILATQERHLSKIGEEDADLKIITSTLGKFLASFESVK